MSANLAEYMSQLPLNLANHLKITMMALLFGVSISLPLSVFLVKHPRTRYPALTVVSVIQTVPSLALLALMVPLLVGLSVLTEKVVGVTVPALGFYPTIVALTLYSMLPIVRNTVTGIVEVDPAMKEAARGVGMTAKQQLFRVELPLAAPVIISGIRTATVWIVGIATLATVVGQRCLGNYIFRGLQTRNWAEVLFGCIAAMLLAILLDLLIGGVQRSVKERHKGLGLVCLGGLLALVLVGTAAPRFTHWVRNAGEPGNGEAQIRVGSKAFTEQYILATLLTDELRGAGFDAWKTESLGSTVVFDALVGGQVDCYVDYTGTVWANYMEREQMPSPEQVLEGVTRWLEQEHGVVCLGELGFENAYALAMRRKHAERLGIKSIAGLSKHAGEMTLGSDYEFVGRPEWQRIRAVYGLSFADQVTYDPTFMYEAVANGEVDVIPAFTTDGRIEAYDLKVLKDPQNAIPPYDAIVLLSRQAARRQGVKDALRPLLDAIPDKTMRQANYRVDRDKDKYSVERAAEWLRTQIGARKKSERE